MARKRMIDPDFWTDESLGMLDRTARLLFMGLISQADDDGRLRGNPALIRSLVFPYDDDLSATDVDHLLTELHERNLIRRYVVDGQQFIWITNFAKHQTINKPTASKLPAPPDPTDDSDDGATAPPPEDYGSPTEPLPPKLKEEKLSKEKGREANARAREAPDKPVRKRDLLFEQIVSDCYGKDHTQITKTERNRANQAAKELREVNATPEDVSQRAERYRARSPDYPLTPQTLTKMWTELERSRPIPIRGNQPREPDYSGIDEFSRTLANLERGVK